MKKRNSSPSDRLLNGGLSTPKIVIEFLTMADVSERPLHVPTTKKQPRAIKALFESFSRK